MYDKEYAVSEASHFNDPGPSSESLRGVARDVALREFAKRLQNAMLTRGWNQSEMARAAANHMESGKFGRDNISNYIRGLVVPGPLHLNALAKALDMQPDELMPSRPYSSIEDKMPSLDVRDIGSGKALVRINMVLDWDTAIKVLQLAKEGN